MYHIMGLDKLTELYIVVNDSKCNTLTQNDKTYHTHIATEDYQNRLVEFAMC